jgi:two-component system chemotaxis response regulator CheY
MDITMPDMNGIEATKIIKEKYSDAKILMVTSHAQKSMVIDALDAGACGYLIKPIEIVKLEEAINRAMKLRS